MLRVERLRAATSPMRSHTSFSDTASHALNGSAMSRFSPATTNKEEEAGWLATYSL